MKRIKFSIILILLLLCALTFTTPATCKSDSGTGTRATKAGRDKSNRPVRAITAKRGEKLVPPLTSDEYRRIRRRYRHLEFFSLGFLLLVSGLISAYFLRHRVRSQQARKSSHETYRVEELGSEGAIVRHLTELSSEGTLLQVIFDPGGTKYHTSIDSVYKEKQRLAILPLSPPGGNLLMDEGSSARFEYICREVPYSFITRAWADDQEEEKKKIVAIPELIKYTQRRSSYRVTPPGIEPVSTSFPSGEGGFQEAVRELSSDGFSITSPREFKPHTDYRGIKISIPGEKPIKMNCRCAYSIFFKEGKDRPVMLTGFEFIEKGLFEERSLMRYVSEARQKEPPIRKT